MILHVFFLMGFGYNENKLVKLVKLITACSSGVCCFRFGRKLTFI